MVCRLWIMLSVLSAAPALATPNFKSFAGKPGCAAIPYDDLRTECEADAKTETAACAKVQPCDTKASDISGPINGIKQDRKKAAELEQNRRSELEHKSDEERKPDNMPAVQESMKKIRDIDEKIRKLGDDDSAYEAKVRAALEAHVTADQDCMRARGELAGVYDKVEDRAAEESLELVDDIDGPLQSWDKSEDEAEPDPKMVVEAQACVAARSHPLEFIDGAAPKPGGCTGVGGYDGRLAWGNPLHKAQLWCDFQALFPDKYPNPTDTMDSTFSSDYDQIVSDIKAAQLRTNQQVGSAFERAALKRTGLIKNTALMWKNATQDCVDKPTTKKGAFIPDGVVGLGIVMRRMTYGTPYEFVEVKNWKKMSDTGNLKKMIDYVDKCGGQLTIIFRAKTAEKSETEITGTLDERLRQLMEKKRLKLVFLRTPKLP